MKMDNSVCLVSAILVALFSISCSAEKADSCLDTTLKDYFGIYSIVEVSRYSGGMTTSEEAQQRIGANMTISRNQFSIPDIHIRNPVYKFQCFPYNLPEGEVDQNRRSNFYGFGMERDEVKVLEIFEPADKDAYPALEIELINVNEVWDLSDGWLYQMKRQSQQNASPNDLGLIQENANNTDHIAYAESSQENKKTDDGEQDTYGTLTYCKLNDEEQRIFDNFRDEVENVDITYLSDNEVKKIFNLVPADYYLFLKIFNYLELISPHITSAITAPDAMRLNHNNQEECYSPGYSVNSSIEQIQKLDQVFERMMKISPAETAQKIFTILAGPFITDLPDTFNDVLYSMSDYNDVILKLDEGIIRGLIVRHNTSYVRAIECEREYGLDEVCPLVLPVKSSNGKVYKLFKSVADKMEQEYYSSIKH